MYHLPISTLRYYDKEGFFPNLMRKGNIRYFSDAEPEAIRVIECLKRSGLEIKDIKLFFQWVVEGPSSYGKRKELFETRKATLEDEIKAMEKTLALLKFKCFTIYLTSRQERKKEDVNLLLHFHPLCIIQFSTSFVFNKLLCNILSVFFLPIFILVYVSTDRQSEIIHIM